MGYVPWFVVSDLHFGNGFLLMFAAAQRDTESLRAVGTNYVRPVSVATFLVVLVSFDHDWLMHQEFGHVLDAWEVVELK